MRDNGITIGKALAIMLMVLGHTRFSPPGISFIYMFHIPAFFFFSGYCFKEKYMDAPVKSFIVKRINGLWLPFVKYGLLFLLLHNVFFHLNIYNDVYGYNGEVSRIYDVKDFVAKAIHIVFTMTGEEQLLGAFWFLRTLLWSSVIGYGILRFRNQELKLVLWGGVILLASYLLLLADLRVPFFAIGGRELLATFFFLVGVAYKRSGFRWECSYATLPICLSLLIIGSIFWPTNVGNPDWRMLFPYSVSAMGGSIILLAFGKILDRTVFLKNLLIFIGDHTMEVLIWHFLCFKLVSFAIIQFYHLPIENLAHFPVIEVYSKQGWWFVYWLVGVAIPLTVTKGFSLIKTKING